MSDSEMLKRCHGLFFLILSLNVLDVVLTLQIIMRGGEENNYWLGFESMFEHGLHSGIIYVIFVKILILSVLAKGIFDFRYTSKRVLILLSLVTLAYTAVNTCSFIYLIQIS